MDIIIIIKIYLEASKKYFITLEVICVLLS